ncbi:uncharacterized protein [Parasteatoda tepidariorum]|uniref:uncharacterized protein n=1 Tax=Parasteatoda tepidariorum TaxID=114398 RepID=UPI0039BC71D0
MTCAVNPIFKSCGFLGIDYYEEVSDTFEENISDALIPETSVLSVDNYLKNIKVPGRRLWKEFQPDTEFLLDEAKKLEDFLPGPSIPDIIIPNPLINFNNDFEGKFSDEIPLEENNERSFMSDELLLGCHCPLIEVPFIPFTLLKYKPKSLPLSKLLETLPVMEIEDIFNDDVIDYSFQDIDISLLKSTEDLITKQPFNDEIELKKLPLPEVFVMFIVAALDEVMSHEEIGGLMAGGLTVAFGMPWAMSPPSIFKVQGHCPLIEVPVIPFTLLKYKPKLLPLSKLLETLPVMEIEDIFDDVVIDYSFQNIDISLLESTDDLISKQPFNDEIELKELPLPELLLEKSSDYVRDIENVTWNDNEFMECVQNISEDNLPPACSSQNTARKSQESNGPEKCSFNISFDERCIAPKTFLSPSPHVKNHEENESLKSVSQNACKRQIAQEQTADHLELQNTHEKQIILKQNSPYNSSTQNALINHSIQKPVTEKSLDHPDLQNACENLIIQKTVTGQVSDISEQSVFEKHLIQNPAAMQAPPDNSEPQSGFEKQIFEKQNTLDHSESPSTFGKQIFQIRNTLDNSESQSAFGKQIYQTHNTLDHSESLSEFEKQIFGKQNTSDHSESQSAFGKQIFQKSSTELASDYSELQSASEWQVFSETFSQAAEHPELKIKHEKHILSKPFGIQTPKHSKLCENSEISQTENVNLSNPLLSKDINVFQNKFNLRDSATPCPLIHSADLKIRCQTLLSNHDQCYDSNSTPGNEAKCYLEKLSDLKLNAAVKNRCLVDTSAAFRSNNNREDNIGKENTVSHNNKESKGVAYRRSVESAAKDMKSSTPKQNICRSVNLLSSFLTAKSIRSFEVDSSPSSVLKDNLKKHSATTSSSTILNNLQNGHQRASIEPTAKHEFADLQVVLSGMKSLH